MQASTKHAVTIAIVVVLLALIGAWWASDFSLEFMRFFASQDGGTSQTSGVNQPATPAPPSGAVGCAPATQTVAVGTNATLTASGGGGEYTWTAPEGTPASGTGGSFAVSYATEGTKRVLVSGSREQVASGSDRSPHDVVSCEVVVTTAV
jgi:hypothetical protein